jgi:hypothetical protein
MPDGAPIALAGLAGIRQDRSRSLTLSAGGGDGEETLASVDLAVSLAGRARLPLRSGSGALTAAIVAPLMTPDLDLLFDAETGLLEGELQLAGDVAAPPHFRVSATAGAETEEVFEDVAEGGKMSSTSWKGWPPT